MKSLFSSIFTLILCAMFLVSCDENEKDNFEIQEVDLTSLVGKVETRQASEKELSSLKHPANFSRVGCTLDDDKDCGDAVEEVEYYIQNCTTYPKSWPPSGVVKTYYKGLAFYVDSDSDINLDQYQDDLQAHVNQIISVEGSAAFISGDVISWPCNRGNNAGVIAYTVYK
ncbi:hypothetical protein [Fulvivirga sediminis]|uniref:Uncharacterized protein n=1 Tax=Fulvivirga sediminis TaxID=2803949 RepID=A0A937K0M3_9BACT|nr:hypothetical protein [Fulvivirga sediminis]MBL3657774.1 hypothetical protein [Fulvivirga sediminis]